MTFQAFRVTGVTLNFTIQSFFFSEYAFYLFAGVQRGIEGGADEGGGDQEEHKYETPSYKLCAFTIS